MITRHSLLEHRPDPEHRAPIQCRVLVVEDQRINQTLARRFLEAAGCEAGVAGNGRIALEMLAAQAYDLVLMDCHMPELDGFAATERIRGQEAGTPRRLPIIAMTANAMAGDRDRCLAAGMDDYLTKPITRDALLHAVARWAPKVSP